MTKHLVPIEPDLAEADPPSMVKLRKKSAKMAAFANALFIAKPGFGGPAEAARLAGYNGDPATIATISQRLINHPMVIEAVIDITKRRIGSLGPQAINMLQAIMANPIHKDSYKSCLAILDRISPLITKQEINVTHEGIDPTMTALRHLKYLLSIRATEDQLLQVFGVNGLPRYRALLSAQEVEGNGPIVDVEFTEVEPTPEPIAPVPQPEPDETLENLEDIL
jgi:hypothetical protein